MFNLGTRTITIMSRVIIWGGTGQAKLVRPILEEYGSKVVAVFDDTPNLFSPFVDIPIYQGNEFVEWISCQGNDRNNIGFCIAIGNPHGRVRVRLSNKLKLEGLVCVDVVHRQSIIAHNAIIGEGVQILAGAIVQPEAIIGKQCIINANASVDHECVLEDAVEIGPGATLCGLVRVGINAWIAARATVLPRLHIGADAIVGAGAVVTKCVPENCTVVGIPARPYTKKEVIAHE
ncbi:MAG: acetyltransferase [Patescibacteria group bacterium]